METKPVTQDINKGMNTPPTNFGNAGSQGTATAEQKAYEIKDKIEDKASELVDATKQTVADAYDKTNRVVTEAYDKTNRAVTENYQKAMEYGRENPGTLTLIAVGAGIGIGFLLANTYSPRSRASRVVPPVMSALTNLAYDLFRA